LHGKAAELSCVLIPVNDTPEIKEIYPGTSGRTQGDKKEIKPAAKAMKIEISGKRHILWSGCN
jgi:hypothetical protein